MRNITPFLWYQDQAEEAARFYVDVFGEGSRITAITHYPPAAEKVSGKKAGSVMTVNFELRGQPFTAINGGEPFRLSEAVSFVIDCENQEELDYFWEKLSQGSDPKSHICGWLKDKYGLSWQIMPKIINTYLSDPNPEKVNRVMAAVLEMKKIDVAKLQAAYEGN